MRLAGKVAVITGAGKGIGVATAKKFAEEGAKLVLADLNEQDLISRTEEIREIGGEAIWVVTDVTKRNEVNYLFKQALLHYERIEIVINNAGIVQDSQLINMSEEQWDQVIDVNLKGVFNIGQCAAKIMKDQRAGVIINASSVVGIYGNFGQTNYAAAKWGVNGMTKTWAKELGKYGIRVNAIAPGFVETDMIRSLPHKVVEMMKAKSPLNKMAEPADIANGYTFLASDEAGFITGEILSIDGGLVI
ncbi:3-oxoacyl-ACP reductase FabG [Bacillus sp. DTU_2020_1000418_1_SI_GHA_SEK_038]|uniref:3-oxoacyl-ACP reductase FabG n=1 Tax=Bacillus sp. DTU_2020_1000418_1_SI_GHA_SEK_038 TaxID=3077585 RepID=UPI0028E38203|nr:3-oxoacyl-ACP reductase FabG [Bacillus sp. DTU_2020_1000418_1_SI_GHA_SEK_038]WNS76675.1 3-oxoacyl-ACP reductase FabG [Bacillus sp. DTU_2020_1000418_1_SI_GHA_SEK_038]